MVLIRWGTRTPPQILEERPAAARIGWNLPPARSHAGGPTAICFLFDTTFPGKSASGETAAFSAFKTGRIPEEGLSK